MIARQSISSFDDFSLLNQEDSYHHLHQQHLDLRRGHALPQFDSYTRDFRLIAKLHPRWLQIEPIESTQSKYLQFWNTDGTEISLSDAIAYGFIHESNKYRNCLYIAPENVKSVDRTQNDFSGLLEFTLHPSNIVNGMPLTMADQPPVILRVQPGKDHVFFNHAAIPDSKPVADSNHSWSVWQSIKRSLRPDSRDMYDTGERISIANGVEISRLNNGYLSPIEQLRVARRLPYYDHFSDGVDHLLSNPPSCLKSETQSQALYKSLIFSSEDNVFDAVLNEMSLRVMHGKSPELENREAYESTVSAIQLLDGAAPELPAGIHLCYFDLYNEQISFTGPDGREKRYTDLTQLPMLGIYPLMPPTTMYSQGELTRNGPKDPILAARLGVDAEKVEAEVQGKEAEGFGFGAKNVKKRQRKAEQVRENMRKRHYHALSPRALPGGGYAELLSSEVWNGELGSFAAVPRRMHSELLWTPPVQLKLTGLH